MSITLPQLPLGYGWDVQDRPAADDAHSAVRVTLYRRLRLLPLRRTVETQTCTAKKAAKLERRAAKAAARLWEAEQARIYQANQVAYAAYLAAEDMRQARLR